MTTLVVGASGATGRLLVEQLLQRGQQVRVIVRSTVNLPEAVVNHANLSVIEASVLDLGEAELLEHVSGCDAVASCLGHNLSFAGIFGPPHRLVTDAVRRLCKVIKASRPERPVKFVLMSTTGYRQPDVDGPISFGQKIVILLLRLLLPPHVDNERAADYLRTEIGQNDRVVEWAAVRPDNLIDQGEVSEYTVHPSPIRSAIFDAGTTSRINVGHFMAELIAEGDLWGEWKGRMPVIYNQEPG